MKISDIRVWVHLGCTPEERQNPHLVSIDVKFVFNREPIATQTDKLEDAICYLTTVKRIQSLIQDKHFHLIEHLAQNVHVDLSHFTKTRNDLEKIKVKVTKIAPPVPGLHGGVAFYYS